MGLYRQAEFPDNTQFLMVVVLIHGCVNRQLMAKVKDVSVKDCVEVMRKIKAVEVIMKKLEHTPEAQVNVSYARDPTRNSQRNGYKKKHPMPKLQQYRKRSDNKKPCPHCNGDVHPRHKCPTKKASCKFSSKQGHSEGACPKEI